ncbi:nicotinate-nucleotide diphosphorylase (carboxylating) [Leptolyngbya sp. 'hensonii']|uniref:carboxylating nicotinate-nucleotide diphosphorylase n=1 Tax=Leptolyngbya sp. 'hensonii' TaxID=1922337 RepID=UPI00094F937E|nr:carboxylating nicotinate-nucleotide diphosphorylase [Leptolyngbya sp. 'hensonii']OLP18597.1 nicotinate-nucleotide diphosphorylase (carboxylating) [Leptolyngbya sp. 'hensonii']
MSAILPPRIILDPLLQSWLAEDIGRGDRTTQSLLSIQEKTGQAAWIAKEAGIIAGLPISIRLFQLLDERVSLAPTIHEGHRCEPGDVIARLHGPLAALLIGERVALNLTMRLCGIATLTRKYVEQISDLPVRLVDTRKITPGLRLLEKYATQVGGAINHRLGLDDAVMIKDNHIAAAGGITAAIAQVRAHIPYPMMVEVETETLAQVEEALDSGADIIMLDNMLAGEMRIAVQKIRERNQRIRIEASGNITLETIRNVAETGVDYISTSAPVTRSSWLDLSMKVDPLTST